MKHKTFVLIALFTLVNAVFLTACAMFPPTCPPLEPGEVVLEFETVDQDTHSKAVERDVYLTAGLQDPDQLEGLLYENAFLQLANVDYDNFSTVAVFQGHQNTDGYLATIKRITSHEHELRVCVSFLEPGAQEPVGNIETSPYHIVKVPKTDLPDYSTLILQSLKTLR